MLIAFTVLEAKQRAMNTKSKILRKTPILLDVIWKYQEACHSIFFLVLSPGSPENNNTPATMNTPASRFGF